MENNKIEETTKTILSYSRLTIENPDFNATLMGKIRQESRKQALLNSIKYYALMFVGIDVFIVTLLFLFKMNIFDLTDKISDIATVFMSGKFIAIYFIVLISAILFIKFVSGNEYVYSKIHKRC